MKPAIIPFLNYFRDQWLSNTDIWNVHNRRIRTNNDIEGWHYSMLPAIPRHHPDCFTFFNWILQEEQCSRATIAQIDAGQNVKSGNRIYERVSRRIEQLVQEYRAGERSRSSFLRGIT